jgi:hypothetical protein
MKLLRLLDPLERSFFEAILSECTKTDREVLEDQMRRINKVKRYDDPSTRESQTILYWKSCFRVRRDFPVIFPSDRAEERVAETVAEISGERVQIALWMVTGAIGCISMKPHRPVRTSGMVGPNFELVRLFPDRGAGEMGTFSVQ